MHQKSLADRIGPDRYVALMRALPWALSGGLIVALLAAFGAIRSGSPYLLLWALVGFVGGTLATLWATLTMSNAAGALALRTLQPDGSSTPYTFDFSQIESHVVRGDHATAAVLWEAAITERPGDPEVRVRAGDFYAGPIARPDRALALYREVQGFAHAPAERQLYVSQRIVDLYVGPLADKGRAIVELRRIIDRWPNSTAARFGRDALARLKAEHHGDETR